MDVVAWVVRCPVGHVSAPSSVVPGRGAGPVRRMPRPPCSPGGVRCTAHVAGPRRPFPAGCVSAAWRSRDVRCPCTLPHARPPARRTPMRHDGHPDDLPADLPEGGPATGPDEEARETGRERPVTDAVAQEAPPASDLDAWSEERHRELELYLEHDREVEALRQRELAAAERERAARAARLREAELPPELRDLDDDDWVPGRRRRRHGHVAGRRGDRPARGAGPGRHRGLLGGSHLFDSGHPGSSGTGQLGHRRVNGTPPKWAVPGSLGGARGPRRRSGRGRVRPREGSGSSRSAGRRRAR